MSGYLVDTNVLSELIRKRPEPEVLEAVRSVPREDLYTSVICVTEMRFGAARHPRGEAMWRRISSEVLPRVRVLPLTEPAARRAGDILADLESRGQVIGIEDVLIAATAVEEGLRVATRNLRHFERISGLGLESWWPQSGQKR